MFIRITVSPRESKYQASGTEQSLNSLAEPVHSHGTSPKPMAMVTRGSELPSEPCFILNMHTGTTLDLEATKDLYSDKTKVHGYALHGKGNQQWVIERGSKGYTIKNVASGTYLGFAGNEKIQSEKPVTGNSNQVEFDILGNQKNGYTFYACGTMPPLVLDLAGGNQQNGTSVVLYLPHHGLNQMWMIVPVPDRQELFRKTIGAFNIETPKRFRDVKTSISLDSGADSGGNVRGSATCYTSKQKWYLRKGVTGYLIQDYTREKYIAVTSGSLVELKRENGTEFVFDGNDEDGYCILDAVNPILALEIDSSVDPSSSKVYLRPSRRQKWLVKDYQF